VRLVAVEMRRLRRTNCNRVVLEHQKRAQETGTTVQSSNSAAGFCSKRDEKEGRPRRRYATRRSSFTSTSLQEVQDMTIKGGRPSGRGTVRTSFIMPPQEGQRRIARVAAKTMVANPKKETASV
jgi:hypothetical protein